MTFSKFLESSFVSSQVQLAKQVTATGELANNHAIQAWLAIVLKIRTVFMMVLIFVRYLAVLLHITAAPKEAREIHNDYVKERSQEKAKAQKIAEQIVAEAVHQPIAESTGPKGTA